MSDAVPKLKSRTTFPPGGWQFFQAETGWRAPMPTSDDFGNTVRKIQAHRMANPRFNLATDIPTIEQQLETFTCQRLKMSPDFVQGVEKKNSPDGVPSTAHVSGGCRACGRG